MAARTIGGLCARSLRFVTGASLEEIVLRHAVGRPLAAVNRAEGASGVMMIPIPKRGRLSAVEGQAAARGLPGIEEVTITNCNAVTKRQAAADHDEENNSQEN